MSRDRLGPGRHVAVRQHERVWREHEPRARSLARPTTPPPNLFPWSFLIEATITADFGSPGTPRVTDRCRQYLTLRHLHGV